jgi:hypothetical protein
LRFYWLEEPMSKRQFTCAACERVFDTSTSEEDMEAEFVGRYGHSQSDSDEEVVSVCDDCTALILARRKKASE